MMMTDIQLASTKYALQTHDIMIDGDLQYVKYVPDVGCDYFWCMARVTLSLRNGILVWFLHQI